MVRNAIVFVWAFCVSALLILCTGKAVGKMKDVTGKDKVKLVILNPGHYHAALIQKSMYDQIAPVVHVYAPAGPEVQEYLKRIQGFNSRAEEPTTWEEKVYIGEDYFEKMLIEKPGNVVVLSGNNQKKARYIKSSVDAGLNVFCDKPMCINVKDFELLRESFATAEKKGVLLYDIMTERFNIFCILQKMLVQDYDVFGDLQKGSVDEPAVVKESIHHFFKYVSGIPIRRPTWYFDTYQQGEGMVDVTTHLIDLVMWTCFPEQPIDYQKDITMIKGRRWPTMITRHQFEKVTGALDFPDFLRGKLNDEGTLPYYANGQMVYTIKGVYVKISVIWNFQAPPGGGDTHYSLFRGSKANVIIRQGREQDYQPQLYVESVPGTSAAGLAGALKEAIAELQSKYPGLALKRCDRLEAKGLGGGSACWQVLIPDKHRIGHEAHFRKITEKYLQYLAEGRLPKWEVSNMIAKYYITTAALQLARK